ncbi:hypothetical protein [Mesorhizobium sp.]|uniref:hypothetical protein n=1 Tax=Mesorhizobium sp. TaxID=1871066 RepID=UPI0025BF1276|nr:hypothetical protein [Mesorhizobium sp.]
MAGRLVGRQGQPFVCKVARIFQDSIAGAPELAVQGARQSEIRIGKPVIRIFCDRRLEQGLGAALVGLSGIAQQREAAQQELVRGKAGHRLARGLLEAGVGDPRDQAADDLLDDVALDREQAGAL